MKSPVTIEKIEETRRQYVAGVAKIEEHIVQLEDALRRARENRVATLGSISACDHLLKSSETPAEEPAQ